MQMRDERRGFDEEARHPERGERGPHRGWHGQDNEEWFEGRGRRGRVERGTMRYVLLDALRDGPKHGYEIIKWLDERTGGAYAPSPGAVYPTLQLLGDLGFVVAGQEDDRRVYALTETGRNALDEHAEAIEHFWARFTGAADSRIDRPEFGFVQDELRELARTVRVAVRSGTVRGDDTVAREVRSAVERCKNDVREIIARGAAMSATVADATDARIVE
jgi:DNA-binding PadR family transcriptional regulator